MLRLEQSRERIAHADLKNARMLGLMGFENGGAKLDHGSGGEVLLRAA